MRKVFFALLVLSSITLLFPLIVLALTAPSVTNNPPTNVTVSTARLQAYLNNDGGAVCQARFGWGLTNQGTNITAYDHFSAYAGSYWIGNTPYLDIVNLAENTTYYFNVQVYNGFATSNGTVSSFTTLTGVGNVSNVIAIPETSSIYLSWTKGTGASQTIIRYILGQIPSDNASGTLLYSGTDSFYEHSGLVSGTTYGYRFFAYDNITGWSSNSTGVLCTVLGVSPTSNATTAFPAGQPVGYLVDPNVSAILIANNPLTPYINFIAGDLGMTDDWLYFGMFQLFLMIATISMWGITHHATGGAVTLVLLSIGGTVVGILGWAFPILYGLIGIGLVVLEARGQI